MVSLLVMAALTVYGCFNGFWLIKCFMVNLMVYCCFNGLWLI